MCEQPTEKQAVVDRSPCLHNSAHNTAAEGAPVAVAAVAAVTYGRKVQPLRSSRMATRRNLRSEVRRVSCAIM